MMGKIKRKMNQTKAYLKIPLALPMTMITFILVLLFSCNNTKIHAQSYSEYHPTSIRYSSYNSQKLMDRGIGYRDFNNETYYDT